ncbi:MAG TPA: hypothetical protein VGL66_02575 [Caulobacteraceae bacterium]|jgi:uncharacterized membrane protein
MILHLHPAMPPLVRDTADAILIVHIVGGGFSIVTGWITVLSKKGERLHRRFGALFVLFMLIMGSAATYLGVVIPEASNVLGGIFAVYLVLTAWVAARRPDGPIGAFERAAIVVPVAIAIADLTFAQFAAHDPKGVFDRFPPPFYYGSAAIMTFTALMDLRTMLAGQLAGRARIARHVWRMCFAFFFACGSFFLGQQKVMPHWMQGSPVLLALGLAPLGFMVVWLLIVWLSGRFRTSGFQAAVAAGGA